MENVVGQITSPTITTHSQGIIIDVAQYQPTDRPIEDRFSINLNATQTRLIVGVYDGALSTPLRLNHFSCLT
jgi:pyruvate dehydrogenase phosphatase